MTATYLLVHYALLGVQKGAQVAAGLQKNQASQLPAVRKGGPSFCGKRPSVAQKGLALPGLSYAGRQVRGLQIAAKTSMSKHWHVRIRIPIASDS